MLMMFVMDLAVFVFERRVVVFVLVAFGEVQPKTQTHERSSDDEPCRQRFVQQHDGDDRADERRQRKIGACPGGAEVAQGEDEKHETRTDA